MLWLLLIINIARIECGSILYICATGRNVFMDRGYHMWNTWGRTIKEPHKFLFSSDEIVPNYPMVKYVEGTDYMSATGKWMLALFDPQWKFDWYFLLDDDAFVVHHNVVKLIENRDPDETVMIGEMSCDYLCGGGGGLVSRGLVKTLSKFQHLLPPHVSGFYDMLLSHVVKDYAGTNEHHPDFHSQPPLFYERNEIEINTSTPISFHYINGKLQVEKYPPPGIYHQLYMQYYKPFTIWSNDFHISPIQNVKMIVGRLTDLRVHFIDKSLSGHCHLTQTCATNLRVLNHANGINPSTEIRHQFITSYTADTELVGVDAMACFHPSAMCELFMTFGKRLFVIATTRYELGRETEELWKAWNENLKVIAENSHNIIGANNLYDAKYIEYFTGIKPVVLPSVIDMKLTYEASSSDILVTEMRSHAAKSIMSIITNLSPRFKSLRQKYPQYNYKDLTHNTAILHIPYQVSIMSLFEQYAMGIPIIVPSLNFLWEMHNKWDVVTQRTWTRERTGIRPKASIIEGHLGTTELDPNNDLDESAFKHWVAYADFYQWPHIIQFDSWEDLVVKIGRTDWTAISFNMQQFHKTMLLDTMKKWRTIITQS